MNSSRRSFMNTGRWNTTKSFDDLMANKGIEPNLPGYTDDQGFEWVIDSIGHGTPWISIITA